MDKWHQRIKIIKRSKVYTLYIATRHINCNTNRVSMISIVLSVVVTDYVFSGFSSKTIPIQCTVGSIVPTFGMYTQHRLINKSRLQMKLSSPSTITTDNIG